MSTPNPPAKKAAPVRAPMIGLGFAVFWVYTLATDPKPGWYLADALMAVLMVVLAFTEKAEVDV